VTKIGGKEVRRKFSGFSLPRGIPADASSAYWPGPRANNKIFPGEISSYSALSLKGYAKAGKGLCKM
jgi:hypothetical protein